MAAGGLLEVRQYLSSCPRISPAAAVGQLRPVQAQTLVKIHIVPWRWIRPGKGPGFSCASHLSVTCLRREMEHEGFEKGDTMWCAFLPPAAVFACTTTANPALLEGQIHPPPSLIPMVYYNTLPLLLLPTSSSPHHPDQQNLTPFNLLPVSFKPPVPVHFFQWASGIH